MTKSLDEIFTQRYELLFDLFIKEFLKESAIVWESAARKEVDHWVSLHDDVIADPIHFLEKWAGGKLDDLQACMLEKFETALIAWALEKMGEDEFRNRLERALADFWRQILVSPRRPRRKRLNLTELAEHATLRFLSKRAEQPYFLTTESKRSSTPMRKRSVQLL